MSVPVVAIVGRPNVGKSSLFNWLARKKIAIVDPTAGVTRDRVSTLLRSGDRFFELVDTGGMGIQDSDNLTTQVEQQIESAIEGADVVLFDEARVKPSRSPACTPRTTSPAGATVSIGTGKGSSLRLRHASGGACMRAAVCCVLS